MRFDQRANRPTNAREILGNRGEEVGVLADGVYGFRVGVNADDDDPFILTARRLDSLPCAQRWLIPSGPDGGNAAFFWVGGQDGFHLGAAVGNAAVAHVRLKALQNLDVWVVSEDRIGDNAAFLDGWIGIEDEHDHVALPPIASTTKVAVSEAIA